MTPKKGDNTKKATGNAKKAEVAAGKAAVANARAEVAESKKWQEGSKDNSKASAAADKAAEAQRKREEKAALLREEEANQPDKPKRAGAKTAAKKSKGLNLSALEASGAPELNATGIDDALDALTIANKKGGDEKIDMHPERRFKAAYTQFEARRLEEMKDEKGLRRQQKVERIRKEFEKSDENPFNQALIGTYDMSREDKAELRDKERERVEGRLASPQGQ